MKGDCVCGNDLCDGYNMAHWDEAVRQGQAERNRRFDERYRKERAVIEAAIRVAKAHDRGHGTDMYLLCDELADAVEILGES